MHNHCEEHAEERPEEERVLKKACKLKIVALLLEVGGGIITGSLALWSDSVHVALDIGGNIVGLYAIRKGRKSDSKHSQHYIETLGAIIVGCFIMAASGTIFWQAWERREHVPEIESHLMLWIALFGLGVNVVNALSLHTQHHHHTVQSVFWHEVGDLASSVMVSLAALTIWTTGYEWPDIAASILIGCLTGFLGLWQIIKNVRILLHHRTDSS